MNFQEAVQSLGTTPEQVEAKLRASHIRGSRRSAGYCPIARYLKSCGFTDVTVSDKVRLYNSTSGKAPAIEVVSLPEGVKQWIMDFDAGKHNEFWG